MTKEKETRVRDSILDLHAEGIYPSAAKISKRMGRNTKTLNGEECDLRRKVFKELDIPLKRITSLIPDPPTFSEEQPGADLNDLMTGSDLDSASLADLPRGNSLAEASDLGLRSGDIDCL